MSGPLTILHGSDIHFGKPHHPEAAEAFLAEAHGSPWDLIVVSGDLTQRAKKAEYEAARTYLDRFPDACPLVLTPGNHDVPLYRAAERIATPFRNYQHYIASDLDTVTSVPGATVVALSSAAPRTAIVNGTIRGRQLAFARAAFEASPAGNARILVTHHPLAPAPDYRRDEAMPGAHGITDALVDMGVELVLAGHLHRAYVATSLDVRPGPEPMPGVVMVHSGTTTSTRGRTREKGRNTCNRIEVTEEHLVIQHHIYDPGTSRFTAFATRVLPRPSAGSETSRSEGTTPLS